MSSKPDLAGDPAVDERLLNAHDLARAALGEITPDATVGEPAGYAIEESGAVSLRFHTTLPGYPGWFWTVTVAVVDDADPTVLELELLPGEGALLAPEWLPWATRLAEYQAAQAALAAASEEPDDDDLAEDELDDVDDLDPVDFDEDGSSLLHSGDVDGVDIDQLDEDAAPDEDDAALLDEDGAVPDED